MTSLHFKKASASLFAIGVVMTVSTGCLLAPINQPPSTPVISGPAELTRNAVGTFSATAVDPDGQRLSFYWGQVPGACPQVLPLDSGVNQVEFSPAFPALGPVCIWVVARDPQGARAEATFNLNIVNAAPVASLAIPAVQAAATTATALYSETRISAAGSFDPDKDDTIAAYSWLITPPGGVPVVGAACGDSPSGNTLCFYAAQPGVHTITLIVTDSLGMPSAPATLEISVQPDQPPCLRDTDQNTSLRLRRFDEAVAFGVAVDDDGDPFPPRENQLSHLRFVWYFRQLSTDNAPWLPLVQFDQSASFRLAPNAFGQGDEVQVRVEVFDRVHTAELACRPQDDVCESSKGCTQRLTWTVRYWL